MELADYSGLDAHHLVVLLVAEVAQALTHKRKIGSRDVKMRPSRRTEDYRAPLKSADSKMFKGILIRRLESM